MEPGGGRARLRRARRAAQARRRDVRQGEAGDADLVHGRDPAHGRHRQRARVLHRAAGHRQRRQLRHRRQHLPRPLQRAGRDRPRPRYRDAAALLRPRRGRVAALVPGLGGRLRLDAVALRLQADDGDARHPVDPLVRRRDAAQGSGHAEGQPQGHDGLRPRRQHRHAHAGGGEGAREARPAGGGRSASHHLGGARRAQERHLPAADRHAVRVRGSRTASNRSLQWDEQVVKPIFESKDDYEVMYLLAKKLGFADRMFKNIKVENNLPVAEDILREINRGGWSTGYCGQSPERLKAHMANQTRLRPGHAAGAEGRPEVGGDYYGLPWPCWGTPETQASRHPHALQHAPAREGRRRHVPRALRRRARDQDQGAWRTARRSRRRSSTICSPKAPTRSAPRSRTDIPSSPTGCSRSSAGTRT